ncbi:hypothetical protein ALI22I_20270 [Saccharothrix sp. ALI-22-I]|uniref:relaxase/mobilization nuclease domain-containing protein n=1 Tax=Saccharothrix sp. ALI-22-I TaxID=1933778 RepID=UPI00097CA76E|nr:relaxase/mobilization nuclease domain-containing protein [Saccharothrix sp. ALI-22-I]ONI88077.1 hypothetical protein ALI22I_20270 [Saccharothrix sp. ALI-22-I]
MIAKVVRGHRPSGLLHYLFGPGSHEEHRDPRVVASWDGAPWLHQPRPLPAAGPDGPQPGPFDLDLSALTATMQEVAQLAGLPVTNPKALPPEWEQRVRDGTVPWNAPEWVRHYRYDRRKKAVVPRPGYVWHTSVRLHPSDPVLGDRQWERVAERLMRATGIPRAGCRWIAVRHGEDHIHLMATLVSETTGRRFTPYLDYRALRQTCRALEREMGLVGTAPIDRTAAPAPTRNEKAKAERLGRPRTAREELRRTVARVAAAVPDGTGFLAELARERLDPRSVGDATGRVLGYTVALPGDLTRTGQRVRYSGTALAPDLTWTKLTRRWAAVPPVAAPERTEVGLATPDARRDALEGAADAVRRARDWVRAANRVARGSPASPVHDGGGVVEGVAHAAGELLTTLVHGRRHQPDGTPPWPAERYDRAARTPHRVLPARPGPLAGLLRGASRRLAAVGVLSGRGGEKDAAAALVDELAGLVGEVASWQQAHGRSHQAAAARDAAHVLSGAAPGGSTRDGTASRPDRVPEPPGVRWRPTATPPRPDPRPRGPGPG